MLSSAQLYNTMYMDSSVYYVEQKPNTDEYTVTFTGSMYVCKIHCETELHHLRSKCDHFVFAGLSAVWKRPARDCVTMTSTTASSFNIRFWRKTSYVSRDVIVLCEYLNVLFCFSCSEFGCAVQRRVHNGRVSVLPREARWTLLSRRAVRHANL